MDKIKAGGAILIGGKSRRFGKDKVELEWDGIPLPVSLYHRLYKTLSEVFFITGHNEKIKGYELFTYTDILSGNGPLGGVHSALTHTQFDYIFISAGDLPFLDNALITLLFNEVKDEDALVPVWGTKIEPLAAFYRRTCLPVIENDLRNGQREVRLILSKVNTRFLDLTRYYTQSQIEKIFFNINHPVDYQRALKMI